MQERTSLHVAHSSTTLSSVHKNSFMWTASKKVHGKYINRNSSKLFSFLCRKMNLTEYFVFLSIILCCLIPISELKHYQDVIRQLVAALEILPPTKKEETLSGTVSDLFPPIIPHRICEPLNPTQVTGQTVLTKVRSPNLAIRSTRRFVERRALHERCQAVPDPITELVFNKDQLQNLKARVNRWFLVGYDCSKPMDVKPVSSFIHDPCDLLEANEKETYGIQPVTQFQIVQYETRREFLDTRCERYVSQFTYYCGNDDHASPLLQENFFRRPKLLAYNECRSLAMGQYRAGDGKT